ncbi:MAG: hypothetical protein JNL10_11180 [Verrucomicrobiales bacterium]|nr:hypothetical protein [Verrucomicrobiales bacterium]
MKTSLLSCCLAAAALVAGCQSTGSKSAAPAAAPAASASAFDTSALVAAFKNADIPSNQIVQGVVSALSNKDYSGALASLQKLARIPGLTASQASAVQSLIGSVSTRAK